MSMGRGIAGCAMRAGRLASFLCVGLATALLFAPGIAGAIAVGDDVLNPDTGLMEKVTEVQQNGAMVRTDQDNIIALGTFTVGSLFPDPDHEGVNLTITATHANPDTHEIDSLTLTNGEPGNSTVVRIVNPAVPVDHSVPADTGGVANIPAAAGDKNVYVYKLVGARGGDGRDGWGLRICIFWCFTIGVESGGGGDGSTPNPNPLVQTIDAAPGAGVLAIESTAVARPGIWVSSLGGRGGDGGDSYVLSWSSWAAAGGGKAGAGGDVGVTVDSQGAGITISTSGERSHGVFVQSRAGGAGNGGDGYIFDSGGSGGGAAQAGSARLDSGANILTTGDGANGLLVQSLGGGGGEGGDSYGLVGRAGSGSEGGHGATAEAINRGSVHTQGEAAHGVVVQSIGGDGGDAGDAAGIVGIGGNGDRGGNGALATFTNATGASIFTEGARSFGVLVQSIGGGGGNGGLGAGIVGVGGSGSGGGEGGPVRVTAESGSSVHTTGVGSHAIVAQSIGGGGGDGGVGAGLAAIGGGSTTSGNGAMVTVATAGGSSIDTEKQGAYGILAQSIGGGGGSGATAGGVFAVGGKGGAGGNGGAVMVTNGATIHTLEIDAKGIVAQSIGGGGGSANGSGGLFSIGGSGESGGNGGAVTVLNTGFISTQKAGSDGVLAQSIGGGGGNGGSSGGLASLGGSGSRGGNAGTVDVINSGTIVARGARSHGILAQSIGGGGGTGGDSGGLMSIGGSGGVASYGAMVTVTNLGGIRTTGNQASAIEAESIGGGGGSGGTSGGIFFTLGGKGGKGGDGGRVFLSNAGRLVTEGNDSHGIFAQSVGGGGGNGGSSAGLAFFGGASIGGGGGNGGASSEVGVVSSGEDATITTLGDRAKGIFAQSVGGGGGTGGFSAQLSIGYGLGAAVSIGGSGGNGGNGGSVGVRGDSSILTQGLDSDGILAQSVGGGGGNGGFALAFAGAIGDAFGASLGVSVGGTGGLGGHGGAVRVDAGGDIETLGDLAEGLIAQSIGGGGGTGGFSVSVAAAAAGGVAGSISVGVGGSGGFGGNAGPVQAKYDGDILTHGDESSAAIVQAVGGGGGNGGFNVSGAIAAAGGAGLGVAVGVGGAGGGGGIGGAVDADFSGSLTTLGERSSGLIVQSIGGRGGNGGFNVSGSIGAAGGAGGGVSVGVGGAGGDAGSSARASGSFTGDVLTLGTDSDAVLVQSLGGGGGNGGFSVSGSIAATGGAGLGVAVGVGGSGGGGGNGNDVVARILGTLLTAGDRSSALIAQSLGGGGGNGGMSVSGALAASGGAGGAVAVGVGGAGGGGGNAGSVDARFEGEARTAGQSAAAVTAQSVGGGGGTGGLNVSGALAATGGGAGAVAVGVGGSGGGGGTAARSRLEVDALVLTGGDDADGVLSQSVGGGGGQGALNVSGALSLSSGAAGAIAVGVGGSGGGGGAAGDAEATVSGSVETYGARSRAIAVQSVGGGGGNGGLDVAGAVALSTSAGGAIGVGVGGAGGDGGNAGAAAALVDGTVVTAGEGSHGLFVQSIGGGGGGGGLNVTGTVSATTSAGGSIAVGVGGLGGGGGNGGAVHGEITGTVITRGAKAYGVLLESVGGGGGDGGLDVAGAIDASKGEGGAIAVGVGGSGGGGGTSAAVSLVVDASVVTEGDDAGGVLAQSVGGGGGNGGLNVSGAVALATGTSGAIAVGVGGSGGGGGNADTVTASLVGSVETLGDRSRAIAVQSVGGGGGNGGLDVSGAVSVSGAGAAAIGVGVGGAGGDGGNAAAVTASLHGDAVTHGDESHGVFVQSIGGGGGAGGLNVTGTITAAKSGAGSLAVGVGGFGGGGGDAGAVNATLTGKVATAGDESVGVLLESVGGGGGAGGLNVSGSISLAKSTSGTAAVGVGGFGGDGGDGAAVTGSVTGSILTLGDQSTGVLAQSVGGGGGHGGLNVSGSIELTTDGAAAGAVGIGGFGGGGGDGAAVSLTRTGTTLTWGANADGIIAQSVGGGGGAGGLNVSGAIAGSKNGTAFAGTFGLGGFGGGGGIGGDVTARIAGDVLARGLEFDGFVTDDGLSRRVRLGGSNGVLAQSVGGGGGSGGLDVTGGIALATGDSGKGYALNIGIGGFGGAGGNAGTVDLAVDAAIVSAIGDQRFGVAAQSIGGKGGQGGLNVSGGIVLDGQLTGGVGGFGGDGGLGGNVTAHAFTDVAAAGAGAIGLLAQSVGGGGGNGGFNVSGGIAGSKESSTPSVVVGVGGYGGDGNRSGDVTVAQRGTIGVEGAGAIGILAQSIAGGGGNGGFNISGNAARGKGYIGAIGVGGSGGTGADAGDVWLTSNGSIFVDGTEGVDPGTPDEPEDRKSLSFRERANGILAQSVGGGGGNGGWNITGVLSPNGNPFTVGVGGSGSGGGDAGAVHVERGLAQAGVILTDGNAANGLTAQSIGGGGGNASFNINVQSAGILSSGGSGSGSGTPAAASEPAAGGDSGSGSGSGEKKNAKQASITIGGSGGEPGHGSTVDVNHVGDIGTTGRQSDGILAQSVGGGGGHAGVNFAGGANRNTTGFDFVLGGAPGEGGNGGAVTVAHQGRIETLGNDAVAIFAQSVGGGGGDAEAEDSAIDDFKTAPEVLLDAASDDTRSVNLQIGRRGGTGGTGGAVAVTSDGALTTAGDRAFGVMAQSVGNGGGVSSAGSLGVSGSETEVELTIGLEGGDGGRAGSVSVATSGYIGTTGRDAHAIVAQSVGGGGGVGGAVTSKLLPTGNVVSVGIGGAGGTGGVGGTVTVNNRARLATTGDGSYGIHAQSLGGGGGDGGYAGLTETELYSAGMELLKGALKKEDPLKAGAQFHSLIGGSGGTGAKADSVGVANSGTITTTGARAFGIDAQSVGGGGGGGAMVLSGTISAAKGSTQSVSIDVGGSGGEGGSGGAVSVTNTGIIYTTGEDGYAIRAQSLGGGGGNGGLVADLTIAAVRDGASQMSAQVSVGGIGGEGGTGGNVEVQNLRGADGQGGILYTEGKSAHGIYAQSVGGGGGNGSSVISAQFAGGQGSVLAGVSTGGRGGSGNTAGNVTVRNEGAIETLGEGAHGVFAQSIGGGGGNGGLSIATNGAFAAAGIRSASPLITLGGAGGDGSDAGAVTVTNSGTIVTRGRGADGIRAQSIGGGGGNAGLGIGLTNNAASTLIAGAMSALLGGSGGEGGQGGAVTVHHSGDITVLGANSRAVVAESLNGGGGHVALDFSGITTLPGGSALPGDVQGVMTPTLFTFRAGGEDVQHSNAARVTLDYSGTFGAGGDDGAASAVQAIGGGGGTYDLSVSLADSATAVADRAALAGRLGGSGGYDNAGGDIAALQQGDLLTDGDGTLGLLLQSIGGGGGRANLAITSATGSLQPSTFALGGEAGQQAGGGDVAYTQSGDVATSGTASHGGLVQSIGGGGGALGFRLERAVPVSASSVLDAALEAPAVPSFEAVPPTGAASAAATVQNASVSVALGSSGGTTLDGGAIALDLTGDVETGGGHAAGLILQSIGGGGGVASVIGAERVDVSLGGTGGAGGSGGALDVTHAGGVATFGAAAHGVILQSIGGGGGLVLTDAANVTLGTSSANAGDGGAIRFSQSGDVLTRGAGSFGLVLQSLGGGGGFVDGVAAGAAVAASAGGAGRGGAISLTLDGSVHALGDRSTALFLQSAGRDGAGDIAAILPKGREIVGGTRGVGVEFSAGADNRLEILGTLATLDGYTGLAVRGGSGNETLLNRGTLIGGVDLGGGVNRLDNLAGGTFAFATRLALGGADSVLVNAGVMVPGGNGSAATVPLSGSFRQASSGRMDVDLDFSRDALDAIVATGRVQLGGTLRVTPWNLATVKPGSHELLLFHGDQGVQDEGLRLDAFSSVVIAFELTYPDVVTAMLGYDVDFAPTGLAGNRVAIGQYFNRVQTAGSSPALAATIDALVQQTQLARYAELLTQMGAEFYAEQEAYVLGSAQQFGRTLQDCGTTLPGWTDADRPGCAWARADIGSDERDAVDGLPSGAHTARRWSQGWQRANDSGWTFGLGAAFERDDGHAWSGLWRSESTTLQAGVLARRAFGPWSAGLTVTLGNSDQEVRREIAVTQSARAVGQRDIGFGSAVLDLARSFEWRHLTLTPALNLGATTLRGRSATETGAGVYDAVLAAESETHTWVEPTFTIGYDATFSPHRRLRLYARVGALRYLSPDETVVLAGIAGAPAGVAPMRLVSILDPTRLDLEGGLELMASERFVLALSYAARHSSTRDGGTGTARFVYRLR